MKKAKVCKAGKARKRNRRRKAKTTIHSIVMETLNSRAAALADNITSNNALLKRLLANRPKPKKLTKAQIAKRKRDIKRGEMYLAKAHALGVYDERDY